MPKHFEIITRGEGLSRIARIKTKHGEITTPSLLPVVNPKITLVTPSEIRKMGFDAIITNSYIIYKDKILREKALSEGVHKLVNFDGPIMTDSGTFQSYVYGEVDVDPLEIVSFQREIGVDIGTILDVFTLPTDSYDTAKQKVDETIKRAKESLKVKGDMMLSYPIQGGIYNDLREYAARIGKEMPFEIYPIGGVVPLMEAQKYRKLVEVIIHSKKGLGPARPVHLFGCGHPILFPLAVLLGIDLFDSASYAKYARDNRVITPTGTLRLEEIEEFTYPSPFIEDYSPKELLKMDRKDKERILSLHNLYVVAYEIKRVREAIRRGELWELVEMRSRAHPALLSALRALKKYVEYLEKYEPISLERAFFYTSAESLNRPIVYRVRKRVRERFIGKYERIAVISVEGKPYFEYVTELPEGCDVYVRSIFGPVPILWDQIYPIAQSEEPEIPDKELIEFNEDLEKELCLKFLCIKRPNFVSKEKVYDEIDRLKAIADYQFGPPAGNILFEGHIKIEKSRTTGKVRMIYRENKPILFLRPNDGLYTLKFHGGLILSKKIPKPRLRVYVTQDSAEFNAKGKNVFAKFVIHVDPEIRPGDEVLIVDESDNLVAVGSAKLSAIEMLEFDVGIAVKVKDYLEKYQ